MSFLLQEPSTFVNIKLTDVGRKLLSEGKLNYSKAVYSDREIDYNIDRTGVYNIPLYNRVLSPRDGHPSLPPINYDGTPAIDLTSRVFSGTRIVTADTISTGFYTGNTYVTGTTVDTVHDYILDTSYRKGSGIVLASDLDGTQAITISASTAPSDGDLALMVFRHPEGTFETANIQSNAPFVALWYRVTGTTTSLQTDRNVPNFGGTADSSAIHFYPWNGIRTYYGSASTMDTKVWNLNIVRSNSEIGTSLGISGYTTYGSIEYSGQKHYLGFDTDQNKIGIIHYTNEYSGNTYSEQLVPGSVEVDIPHLLWHRNSANAGEGVRAGHRFLDKDSDVYFDSVAQTTYTLLKDDIASDAFTVGRVYPKLKIIVITDPELLTALSYKSNRNWTLPPLNVSLRSTPAPGLSINDVDGCLLSDMTYYVTYVVESENTTTPLQSFGYQPTLHCGYIQKITGHTSDDGYSSYLSAIFPSQSFPYMRSDTDMATYSGTGWNANTMRIIMKGVSTESDPGLDNIGSDGWTVVNSGYGYYIGGEDGGATINPVYAMSYEFIVDQSDIDAGSEYTLNSAFTEHTDFRNTGNTTSMTLGNECFLFGNIKASTMKTTYKTVISLQASDSELNTSENSTFDPDLDGSTYFTEVGVLNSDNRLVAVGKLTRPIEKNDTKFLTLQLEMDF